MYPLYSNKFQTGKKIELARIWAIKEHNTFCNVIIQNSNHWTKLKCLNVFNVHWKKNLTDTKYSTDPKEDITFEGTVEYIIHLFD